MLCACSGRFKEACELCSNAGQPWRAVSLSGAGPWGPLPVGDAATKACTPPEQQGDMQVSANGVVRDHCGVWRCCGCGLFVGLWCGIYPRGPSHQLSLSETYEEWALALQAMRISQTACSAMLSSVQPCFSVATSLLVLMLLRRTWLFVPMHRTHMRRSHVRWRQGLPLPGWHGGGPAVQQLQQQQVRHVGQ